MVTIPVWGIIVIAFIMEMIGLVVGMYIKGKW